jgi:hypothetical protein
MFVKQARRQQADRRRRLLTGAFSAAVHGGAIAALLLVHADTAPQIADVEPIPVTLVAPLEPPKPPAPKSESEKPPEPQKPPPPSLHARPPKAPPPADVEPLPAAKGPTATGPVTLSDAETASASTADSGGGGNGCNMARWLQSRLRNDPLVKAAMAEAHSPRPVLVWNGDWVRHGEQEGAGLAQVRESIMWEVGFAPIACRDEPVHGYVLISLNDGSRLAMGAGAWRWSDLLGARRR